VLLLEGPWGIHGSQDCSQDCSQECRQDRIQEYIQEYIQECSQECTQDCSQECTQGKDCTDIEGRSTGNDTRWVSTLGTGLASGSPCALEQESASVSDVVLVPE